MSVLAPSRWTAGDVRALADEPGTRFDGVNGQLLVSLSPRRPRQWALGAVLVAPSTHGRQHATGAVGLAPPPVAPVVRGAPHPTEDAR